MFDAKLIKYALATLTIAAGVFSFNAYADGFGVAEPAESTAADDDTTAPAPHAAPRNFDPYTPSQDNPTNPPGTWAVYPSPTSSHLFCVDFLDENSGWAGGRSVALRYSNGTWSELPGHSGLVFYGIDMLTVNDGWAVGWNGNKEEPAIWRWDGSRWNEFENPTGAVECINMTDATHGWVGGKNHFLRFNGTTWEYGGNAPNTVYGIEMNSDTDGRAVGYKFIMRRVGNVWTQEVTNNNWYLSGISMINASQGWACGQYLTGEKGLLIKYEGSWREYRLFDNVIFIPSLDIYVRDFGWCVGRKTTSPPYGSFIGFFYGENWVEVNSPTNNSLTDVCIIDRDSAWIVGLYGTILKYKPNVSVKPCSLGQIKAIYR